jgi:LacI family transcriptional regulator
MNVPKVLFNNVDGGFKGTSYLISKGHTRIAHISGPDHLVSVQERFSGFRKACIKQRLSLDPSLFYFGTYSQSYGYEAMNALLSRPDPPTAVFAASDFIAIGILEAAQAWGKNVPDDISLVGFDNIPLSNLLNPPLTTIHLPIVELGKTAVRLLHARMQDEPASPVTVRFPVSLIERSSVSAPSNTRVPKGQRVRGKGRK